MEGASAEAAASDPQIPSQLRQRMLNRAATFAEGAQPSPVRPLRRRSSLLSDLSDTRHSTRSSTDNLLRNTDAYDKVTSLEEGNHWLSSPVIFAVFPAVGGLLYQNGAAVLTDIFTLGLASWFLHWCCTFPWYDHSTPNLIHRRLTRYVGPGIIQRSSGGTLSLMNPSSTTPFRRRTKIASTTLKTTSTRRQKIRSRRRDKVRPLLAWLSSKRAGL